MKKWGWILLILLVLVCSVSCADVTEKNLEYAQDCHINEWCTDLQTDPDSTRLYKIEFPTDGYISVDFIHDHAETWFERDLFSLTVGEYNGPYLLNRFINLDCSYGYDSLITTCHSGVPAGTYYVSVHSDCHWNSSSVAYRFRVNFTPATDWETEANNYDVASDPISPNQYYHGSLYNDMDEDYYAITFPSDGYVTVSFSHGNAGFSDKTWYLELLNRQDEPYYHQRLDYIGNITAEETSDKYTIPAGTYHVHIGRELWSSLDYRFMIHFTPTTNLSECTFGKINDQVYTGREIKPKLQISHNGKALAAGTDFTASYSTNIAVGTAWVYVTGIGEYSGSKDLSFVINPASVKLSSLKAGSKQMTVKWKAGKGIDGYEIQYSPKKNFKSAKKVTISDMYATQTVIQKLKAGKNYYVRIRAFRAVNGKTYYSAWSGVKNVKIKK